MARQAQQPFGPGRLGFTDEGVPCAPDFGDVYHARVGAQAQARQVFLAGNQLPERWQRRERFVILESGFGLGNNFVATWAAWRADPQRCERLVFLSIEKHPLAREDLVRALAAGADAADPLLQPLRGELLARWPVLTPDQHLLSFDDGCVQLQLVFADIATALRELDAQVDAFYLDGFAPARNPAMWTREVTRHMGRLAAPDATAATWSVACEVQAGLTAAGFRVESVPGIGGKRAVTRAIHAPMFQPERPASKARVGVATATPSAAAHGPGPGPGPAPAPAPAPARQSIAASTVAAAPGRREALVIGGGLAGCAAAWSLARQGWRATVLDRQAQPAGEASGNPGGLMHGIFNAPDSVHARWFRAAALHTHGWARGALAQGRLAGQLDGLLRLEPRRTTAQAQAQLTQVGLSRAWVDWCEASEWAEQVGWPAHGPSAAKPQPGSRDRGASLAHGAALTPSTGAWHYPTGGWLSPAACCRYWLGEAGRLASAGWQGNATVARIERRMAPDGPLWQAYSADGTLLGEAPVLVLASSVQVAALLASWDARIACPQLTPVRGQTSVIPACQAQRSGVHRPCRALAGQGYAVTLDDGSLLLGATSQVNDDEACVRASDHQHNLQRAVALGALDEEAAGDTDLVTSLQGRVGWRATTADRLPVVGPPVDPDAQAAARAAGRRLDVLRHQPRLHGLHRRADGSLQRHGLYVFSGLGSRGLTSASLAAELLASWITGAPCPVPATLRDALDVARG